MNDMLESQTVRAKRLALRNLQQACQIYHKTQVEKGKTYTALKKPQKLLGKLIRNIRVNRLAQYVSQNLLMNNVFGKRIDFKLKGSNQIDEERLIKWQGVRFNQKILAIIYILELMFVMVTLFLSAFVAFLEGFRNLEYQKNSFILSMNLCAIFFSVCKIGTSVVTKKIKDGITLVYISDIFYDYVRSFVIFIDVAYLVMLISLLIYGNNSFWFGVALFMLCLVKMISCFPNLSVFETTFIKGFRNQNYWKLAKTVIFNIGFAHFLASMLLAMANASETQNWLIQKELNDKDWWIQYMWAYYWATTIMMTIGFGDITATNHSEAIVLAFLQFFSCIVLAYNVSQIGAVISALRSAGNEYQKKISIFKRMAIEDEIDVELKTKIQGYIKQQREIKETYEFNEQSQLLNSIPDNLKKEYINQSNKKFFTHIPFFKNIRKATLMKFTQHLSGRVYYPGEYLLALHEDHENIMILKEGRVGLTYKKQGSRLNGTPVQFLEIGEKIVHVENQIFQKKTIPIILNTNFLNRTTETNYEIIAEIYSFAYSISYENFLSCIKESQVDSSYYFSITHRTSISKNEWLQIQCDKCNQQIEISEDINVQKTRRISFFNKQNRIEALKQEKRKQYHTKFECPKLHFCPLKGIVILKSIKSKGYPQKGNRNYKRQKDRQSHSYLSKKVFRPFQERINIKGKKRLQELIVKDYLQSKQNSRVQERIQAYGQFTLDSNQQVQMLQKLIKKSLHQVIQGYEQGYWELQIDVMNNYLSYFPVNNASNLDNTPLDTNQFNEIDQMVLENRRQNECQNLLISEISEFQAKVQKTQNEYQALPNKVRTSKMKIQTTQGNVSAQKHYFKRILHSDKAIGTSLYSPKYSSNNRHVFIDQDTISDQDVTERDHSVVGMWSRERDNLAKRKSNN